MASSACCPSKHRGPKAHAVLGSIGPSSALWAPLKDSWWRLLQSIAGSSIVDQGIVGSCKALLAKALLARHCGLLQRIRPSTHCGLLQSSLGSLKAVLQSIVGSLNALLARIAGTHSRPAFPARIPGTHSSFKAFICQNFVST